MNLTNEDGNIILTALQNYRAELYLENKALGKVDTLINKIQPLVEKVTDGVDLGSETGIEGTEPYLSNHAPKTCEVCDDWSYKSYVLH